MAKQDGSASIVDVSEFLKTIEQLPPVYDAKDFCNRPFTLNAVDWQVFEASERNRYNATEKLKMDCTEISTGRKVILETTQKGIVTPIAAIEAAGYFPCNLMIAQEGKYCTVQAR